MNRLQFEAKLSSFKSLSTLPAVMAEVLRICDDPELALGDLADVIAHDPALTSRILKIVNSPFYGRPQQVSSIRNAVMTLGASKVKALALSLSLYDLSAKLGSKIELKDFWRHSLNVACVSELIANKVAPQIAEEAFICGCLHDLGVLVLDCFYPKEYVKVFQSIASGEEMVKIERQVLEIDHAAAGELLGRVWNFPDRYCVAIARHHDVFGLNEQEQRLAQIINLADKLATFTFEASVGQKSVQLSNRDVLAQNLGLTGTDLKEIEYAALTRLLEASQHLDVDVGTPMDLLQKATNQLYHLYTYADQVYQELVQTKEKLDEEKIHRVALESLQAIVATFSHYLNNAVASISGRTQLLELAMRNGQVDDPDGVLSKSLAVYEKSAEQITSVIDKLKHVTVFKTAIYHDNTKIIDFEKEARLSTEQVQQIVERKSPAISE
ncbi:MAG: HDOD domain-containing protein [candidate division Zixibacteria bacterium]|nr:HDOD domain-containing protein [candidate division Zixibacteria bacterium]